MTTTTGTSKEDATILLRVREIRQETEDTKTFVFERTNGQRLAYQAGQFLTFLMNHQGHETRRSYSFSSAPSVDVYPSVTIKRVENGEMSRFWLKDIQVGDWVRSLPPSGRFVHYAPYDSSYDLVLIGAGSGITPLFSILKEALTTHPMSQVTLLYANRDERHIIFKEALHQWQQRFAGRLNVIHLLSNPSDRWPGLPARLNNSKLEKLLGEVLHSDRSKASFFVCGPFSLMRTAEITLRFMGVATAQIRKENFVVMPPPAAVIGNSPHRITLLYKGHTYHLHIPSNTTVLQAALDQGIPLPYSCKGGVCATCAGLLKEGKVQMSINDVLTDNDLKQGWILTCTAYPQGNDVKIDMI